MIFTTNAIDYTIPDNNASLSDDNTTNVFKAQNLIQISLDLRLCLEGEELLPNGQC